MKNNLPILPILFPLLCVKFLLNRALFFKKFIFSKENIINNMGRLFFTSSLNWISHTVKKQNKNFKMSAWQNRIGSKWYPLSIWSNSLIVLLSEARLKISAPISSSTHFNFKINQPFTLVSLAKPKNIIPEVAFYFI